MRKETILSFIDFIKKDLSFDQRESQFVYKNWRNLLEINYTTDFLVIQVYNSSFVGKYDRLDKKIKEFLVDISQFEAIQHLTDKEFKIILSSDASFENFVYSMQSIVNAMYKDSLKIPKKDDTLNINYDSNNLNITIGEEYASNKLKKIIPTLCLVMVYIIMSLSLQDYDYNLFGLVLVIPIVILAFSAFKYGNFMFFVPKPNLSIIINPKEYGMSVSLYIEREIRKTLRKYHSQENLLFFTHRGQDSLIFNWPGRVLVSDTIPIIRIKGKNKELRAIFVELQSILGYRFYIPTNFSIFHPEDEEMDTKFTELAKVRKKISQGWIKSFLVLLPLLLLSALLIFSLPTDPLSSKTTTYDQTGELTIIEFLIHENQAIEIFLIFDNHGGLITGQVKLFIDGNIEIVRDVSTSRSDYNSFRFKEWIPKDSEFRLEINTENSVVISVTEGLKYKEVNSIELLIHSLGIIFLFLVSLFLGIPQGDNLISQNNFSQIYFSDGYGSDREDPTLTTSLLIVLFQGFAIIIISKIYLFLISLLLPETILQIQIGYPNIGLVLLHTFFIILNITFTVFVLTYLSGKHKPIVLPMQLFIQIFAFIVVLPTSINYIF